LRSQSEVGFAGRGKTQDAREEELSAGSGAGSLDFEDCSAGCGTEPAGRRRSPEEGPCAAFISCLVSCVLPSSVGEELPLLASGGAL
jgi:hypothetical protein